MKRMTTVPQAALVKCCGCVEESNCYSDISCNEVFAGIEKLKAYEDTGLDPEDIGNVKTLAIQYLKKTIRENTGIMGIAKVEGYDTARIIDANRKLEEFLLTLTN